MGKCKKIRMLGFVLVMAMVVTACGKMKEDKFNAAEYSNDVELEQGQTASEPNADLTEENSKPADNVDEDGMSNTSAISSKDPKVQTQDKIIRRFLLDVETQDFDDLIHTIDLEMDRLGGYVENSQISGKRFYYDRESRNGNIIIRIPRDRVDDFVNAVNENANVVNKEESTENVTLQYIDMESRKKSLEIEQERLFVLLEKTATLENIITLESRLSEIRFELQSYETQLRTYDNLVEYSTVTLRIQEVERITPVIEEKQTVATRIQNGFSDTMYNLSEGFKNFFVWFVVNIPYLIIWGVIITGVMLIVKRYQKKKKGNFTLPPTQGPDQKS